MIETSHRHRTGLVATVAGIAALGGAGTLAAVLPAPGPSAVRHLPVLEAAVVGLRVSGTGGATAAARDRGTAAVPGAGPFPRTSDPITSVFA